MKLAIVGGSAHSTPALFAQPAFANIADRLDVVLAGRSPDRLAAVRRAILEIMTRPPPIALAGAGFPEMRAGLDGADVILLQARYGGYEGRARDETFPLKYGICGDEGLGPGGLAAGWRAWPELSALYQTIREATPNAIVLMMTSPVGLLVRCARECYPEINTVGICELPWATLNAVCKRIAVPVERVRFGYAGVNHLGWFYSILEGDRDLVREFADRGAFGSGFPTPALIRTWGAIPLKYLRLHLESEAVVAEQRAASAPRGAELLDVQERAFAALGLGNRDDILAALARRPSPWYDQAVAPLVAALIEGRSQECFFLTVRNDGYYPDLEASAIVEIPHEIAGGAMKTIVPTSPPSEHILDELATFVRYERAAAAAIVSSSPGVLRTALRMHPWVAEHAVDGLADDITADVAQGSLRRSHPAARATSSR
jgi:6-phospho-beta-glucosidase